MIRSAMRAWSGAIALVLLAFVGAPAPALGQTIDYDSMTPAEREAFGDSIRSYLLDNPGVIREAIEALQAQQESAERLAESSRVRQYMAALHDTTYHWEGGNPDGDITMVEFADYRCAFCKRAHPVVKEVLERDDRVRLIVREYPILGPDSVAAGRMAMAAFRLDPARYPALNDELMLFQGDLTETIAYRIAGQLGFDIAELKELANSPEIVEEIERTYRLADALGVRGTPTFIGGDRIVRGALPIDGLLAEIEAARRATN